MVVCSHKLEGRHLIAMGITLLLLLLLGFLGLRFKLVLLVLLWLRWYFVGSYPLAKC